VVFLQGKEIEHIGMPGLKVNRKASFALTTTLINIPCRHVEVPEHRYDTV
jgi:hypothetical protein